MPPDGCQAIKCPIFYLPLSPTDWTGSFGLGSLLAGLTNIFIILSLVIDFLPFLVWIFRAKKLASGLQVNLGLFVITY